MKKIIAVTGCPTGIAHTFMAEESLKKAAKEMGVEIKVETNGAIGVENELTEKDIKEAIGVIVASDKDARVDRFVGKPIIETSVQDGIHKPKELIQNILDGKAPIKKSLFKDSEKVFKKDNKETIEGKESIGRSLYKHLMNGVSHMLPFVVAGGVLIAVSFLWGIFSADPNSPQYNETAAMIKGIGGTAFSMIVPIFTAYIASSISGRPGMVAGFVGGLIANATGAGFLGGIIAGFFSGYLVLWLIKLLKGLPRQFEGLKSIFLLPILGILATGVLMTLLGQPVAYVNNSVMGWLSQLESANPILLGVVIGCMSAFDFGGPVNKAAYITGTMLLSQGNYYFMAGVSAACITPPLVIALSTTIFRRQFNEEDRAAGLVNYILGFTHITEGAIPFAAKDPLRVIPILMAGSSVSAILTYLMKVQVPAPHGGFLILPLVDKAFIWVGCILIGSLVGAVLYGVYKTKENKKLA
ncbi:PTS fructose transporter subunit IIC [Eubacterium multiforme]|uniref:PTS system fructose-specific IIC component n=1 Tax=Eubacterium multiforme TaxID=83339 RepID=A0ABT9URI1_9FIRM|nr:PTS fructose transporter subunit IIBC [Eubacterium multiforme]MDQ0149011.1 PTS system fructose-specific IIC component [Eubacterium multiforme]